MKKLAVILLMALIAVAGYIKFKAELKTNLAFNSRVTVIREKINKILAGAADTFSGAKEKLKDVRKDFEIDTSPKQEKPSGSTVLHLKRGGVISGRIVRETKDAYVVDWKGGEFVIDKCRINRIEHKTRKEAEWPYENDVVVKRTNGIVSDGKIIDVTDETVTLLFTEGGGSLEMELGRQDIECLIFAPVYNKASEEIENYLKRQFPEMEVCTEGDVTIVTDSISGSVAYYKKTISDVYTEIYLKFFPLFKDRKPKAQNFVVIFDDFNDYVDYAITDGVWGGSTLGYFSPSDDVLYLYNAFGERVEELVFETMIGETGKRIDEDVEALKKKYGKRYRLLIDGLADDVKAKLHRAYNTYKHELLERTFPTLRHEFTHEIFHNWGLQTVVLSVPRIDKERLLEKKKEFLKTEDRQKKKELLMEILQLKKEASDDLDIETAQSWLVEGIATYCMTDPVGSVNKERLFRFQEMARNSEISPIEFVMVFRKGSFVGLKFKAVLNAYAQSWAFTSFLMDRYPDEFIGYQNKIAKQAPKDDEEELAWLLKSLNKDLATLEKEFAEYMNAYEGVEDPYVDWIKRWHEIWQR